MGPRPDRTRNLVELKRRGVQVVLQWGRVRSDAESEATNCRYDLRHDCFNGAASDRTRNHLGMQTCGRPAYASMGPRPIGRGIEESSNTETPEGVASMGPRPIGRGIGI